MESPPANPRPLADGVPVSFDDMFLLLDVDREKLYYRGDLVRFTTRLPRRPPGRTGRIHPRP